MEASRAEAKERRGYLDFSGVFSSELIGMAAALVLAGSLFLPWFETSEDNPNSKISSAGIGPGETVKDWDTFPNFCWLLLAA